MLKVFLNIEPVQLEFFLFEDEVGSKMRAKLSDLGVPTIWVSFPENPKDEFELIRCNVFQQGEFRCHSVLLSEPTKDAMLNAKFDESRNTIIVDIGGKIFCYVEEEPKKKNAEGIYRKNLEYGYIDIISLVNSKNQPITKPRDEYGMALKLEALANGPQYDGTAYRVKFEVIVEDNICEEEK